MFKYYLAKDVVQATRDVFGVSKHRFTTRAGRDRDKSSARMVATWILRKYGHPYRRSWPSIAKELGYATHDTPMRNYRKMSADYGQWVDAISTVVRLLDERGAACVTSLTAGSPG